MTTLIPHLRRPDVSFSRSGRITIAARVARLLDLHPGDAINVALRDRECLLFAVHIASHCPTACRSPLAPAFRARVYPTKRRSHNLAACSVTLARALLDNAGLHDAHRAAFPCGDPVAINSTLYLPIITRLPL